MEQAMSREICVLVLRQEVIHFQEASILFSTFSQTPLRPPRPGAVTQGADLYELLQGFLAL